MTAIYNELDAFPAAWMRNLIAAGHIAPGVVDERSIKDLTAADVAGPGQRHFFAGIGVWSYALRLANVQDDANIWTGSCPCQPFSGAGKRGGFDDERHLWPVWFELIRECRPAVIFGEQVASPDGLAWLDAVSSDLEGAGYAFAAADLCAAGVGAPHIRQRLYFVAYARGQRLERERLLVQRRESRPTVLETPGRGEVGDVADGRRYTWHRRPEPSDRCDCGHRADQHDSLTDDCNECSCCYVIVANAEVVGRGPRRTSETSGRITSEPNRLGQARGLGNADARDLQRHDRAKPGEKDGCGNSSNVDDAAPPGATRGFWADAEWIPCSDGKYRPIEPGTFPLAHGAPARVGRLRGYGNAINAEQAATFIEAALGAIGEVSA